MWEDSGIQSSPLPVALASESGVPGGVSQEKVSEGESLEIHPLRDVRHNDQEEHLYEVLSPLLHRVGNAKGSFPVLGSQEPRTL